MSRGPRQKAQTYPPTANLSQTPSPSYSVTLLHFNQSLQPLFVTLNPPPPPPPPSPGFFSASIKLFLMYPKKCLLYSILCISICEFFFTGSSVGHIRACWKQRKHGSVRIQRLKMIGVYARVRVSVCSFVCAEPLKYRIITWKSEKWYNPPHPHPSHTNLPYLNTPMLKLHINNTDKNVAKFQNVRKNIIYQTDENMTR